MSLHSNPTLMKFLTVFVAAMPEACKTQFSINVRPALPKPLDWNAFKSRAEVFATIEVLGDQISGHVILGLPKVTFLAGASSVFGESFTQIDAGNMDFGGEILNIVYGVAKSKLKDQHNLPVLPAIPKVCLPNELSLTPATGPSIEVEYESDWGPIYCAFCLATKSSIAA